MADESKGKVGFEHWLTNNFWFYYKWYYLLAVFALTFLSLTVLRYAARVDYDVQLCYISETAVTDEALSAIKAQLAANADSQDEKISVGIQNLQLVNERGERLFFENLADPDEYFYLLDAASLELCRNLGYFENAVWLPELSLYAATRDVPVVPYTKEDFPDVDYTQEQIDDSNAYREAVHEEQLQNAQSMIDRMK